MLKCSYTRFTCKDCGLQQEGPGERDREIEEQLLQLKAQTEEMTFANRQLRSDLTDAQTNLALVKGELANAKQQLNDKAHEIDMYVHLHERYVCVS